jgi:nucleotide-binding universal stress UspA family protein
MTRTRHPPESTVTALPADPSYASVLVPLDGYDMAEAALRPARRLAERFGAELHVVAADVQRDKTWWYGRYVDELQQRAGELTPHLTDDTAVDGAITAAARQLEPCLVCMATHGRSRGAAIVGSTFAKLAARYAEPLVAVGPGVPVSAEHTTPSERIVVCLDGSAIAERAVPLASAWARRLGWDVSLVTAADPVLLPREYGVDPYEYLRDIARRTDFEGLQVETHVLWGPAYPHVLIGQHLDRRPADLVVATSHARTGFARAALGSEAARIIHRSPAPVLVQPLPHG